MQVMQRLNREGRLDDVQSLWFRRIKSSEELYYTTADPHEIDNIVADSDFSDDLWRLRDELDAWLDEVGYLGAVPEDILVNLLWPGGRQPVTDKVVTRSRGRVELSGATEGASIAWTTDADDDAHWKLYSGRSALETGTMLRVRAIRIGFRESDEVTTRV